mgnify:CR=1 FL=1
MFLNRIQMNAVGASAGRLTPPRSLCGLSDASTAILADGVMGMMRCAVGTGSSTAIPARSFSCLCEKKLQAVGDIGFRGAGFKVDGADIGEGIFFAEPPDDAFPGNVVGQAPKGLEDDEGPDPLVGVVGDLARHQPALAAGEGLGDEVLHVTVQVLRPGRRVIQGMGPGNALQKTAG